MESKKVWNISDVFDGNGNFKEKGFDPFRCDRKHPFYIYLFDEDGYTNCDAFNEAIGYAESIGALWNSDIAKYIHSDSFDHACHGNYCAIYAWRKSSTY